MKLHVVGIDLGKTVFHLVGMDSTGKVVVRKRCSRRQLLNLFAIPPHHKGILLHERSRNHGNHSVIFVPAFSIHCEIAARGPLHSPLAVNTPAGSFPPSVCHRVHETLSNRFALVIPIRPPTCWRASFLCQNR